MKTQKIFSSISFIFIALLCLTFGCGPSSGTSATSNSGAKVIENIDLDLGADGLTSDQRNVKRKYEEENKTGRILHLYVISCQTGDILVQSTVDAKVTSSGKRLNPEHIQTTTGSNGTIDDQLLPIHINGKLYYTTEVPQMDGLYGSSGEYYYWWDINGTMHYHYPSGGSFLHITDKPIHFGKAELIINMDVTHHLSGGGITPSSVVVDSSVVGK